MTAIAVREQTFTITEVAETTGVSAHPLRYYERIGLLGVGHTVRARLPDLETAPDAIEHKLARYGGSRAP